MNYPYNLTKEEAIRRIEQDYLSEADFTNVGFDVFEQLLACEAIAEAEEEEGKRKSYFDRFQQDDVETTVRTDENVVVNGSDNDTYKRQASFELTESKQNAITKLKDCNYRTPPIKIASLLKIIFDGSNTQQGWWLAVAQQWTPKAINSVLNQMIKAHSDGWATIKSPGAYFTSLIKCHKKRKKKNKGVNGTR